jgi:hypothetical protein
MIFTGATTNEVWPLVRDFHYAKKMPAGSTHCFAVRKEGGLFGDTGIPQAAVIYGPGANNKMPSDALELTRLVRHPDYVKKLSPFVAWSIRWLRANINSPFIFSYADPAHNHHGGIYQALGFIYVGESQAQYSTFYNEKEEVVHKRTISAELGTAARSAVFRRHPKWTLGEAPAKFLYIKPLRQNLKPLLKRSSWQSLPFPKPNAARLLDAPVPTGVSQEHTLGAAPNA